MTDATPAATPAPQPASLPPARVRVRTQPLPEASAAPDDPAAPASPSPSNYEVGYGKPPRHTRFRPGRSGNPKGRPRAAKSLNTIVRENLTQKVAVRTPAGEKKISRIEAVLHKAVEQAMKGNPRAMVELIKLYGNAIPEERANGAGRDDREGDLTAADLAILAALRDQLAIEREAGYDAQ